MLTIEELRLADLPAALRLSTEAGWNQTLADWRRLVEVWPEMGVVGKVDGEVVGTATLAVYGELAWVGMVLVDERFRGRGFGGRVLDAVLEVGRGRGVKTFGLDATGLGRAMYLKRGFRDLVGVDRWVREGNAAGWRAGARGGRAMREGDWKGVLALDRKAVGVDREKLLRHLMGEAGVRGWVKEEGGVVRGFAAARPGRVAWCAGPVVGEDEGCAVEVMEGVMGELARAGVGSVLVDVPRGTMRGWLEGSGFVVKRELVRMGMGAAGSSLLSGATVAAICALELG